MMYTPFLKDLLCSCCSEFWSAICSTVDQSLLAIMSSFNNWPVGVPIYHDEIIETLMLEKVSTNTLEWVYWCDGWEWWSTGL